MSATSLGSKVLHKVIDGEVFKCVIDDFEDDVYT